MYKLSDRCTVLCDRAVNEKPQNSVIWAQRSVLFQEGLLDCAAKGITDQEGLVASGIVRVIEEIPTLIMEDELIVGCNYGDGGENGTYAGEVWPMEQLKDTPENRGYMEQNGFSHERIERFFEEQKTFAGYIKEPDMQWTPEDIERHTGWADGSHYMSHNHTAIGYEYVMREGFEGLLGQVEAAEREHGAKPIYDSMKKICRAGCLLGERYADAACEKRKGLSPGDRAYRELEQIEEICRRVPAKPARTFREALQSFWFAHMINTWEDGINANSLGRLDQILYPWYQKDIEDGILTKEEAFELVCCLWIKLYRDYDVQQATIGGCRPDGTSAVNDLSYFMLDATESLGFVRCLSVRFSAGGDRKFLRRCLEVLGHMKKGVPFFFNDDVLIPALVNKGIPIQDARDYSLLGCIEPVIPGRNNIHSVSGRSNLLKALEYTFGNGCSMIHPGVKAGLETGPLEQFDTYESLEAAVMQQVEHLIDCGCNTVAKLTKMYGIDAYGIDRVKPYKSLLTRGCIESGRDFNDGGAVYDFFEYMMGGIPNLADSLTVIRRLVYEDKRLTLQEFYEQLKKDFPDEAFRMECVNKAPKYGNDIDEVDGLAARIIHVACDELEREEKKHGLSFHAQPFTFWWLLDMGQGTAATPDGRHSSEIVAYSMSPMQGRDFNGLTALLNSLCKMPTYRCPAVLAAIVEVDPKLFTDANLDRFTDILTAAASCGLSNVQFNIVDAETLIDAQKYPEKYSNLAVRVTGFSQKFNLLSKDLQDHIIGRTKHKCL